MNGNVKAPASVAAESEGQVVRSAPSKCLKTESPSTELCDPHSVRGQPQAQYVHASGPRPVPALSFQEAKSALADWARDIASQGRRAELLGDVGLLTLEQLYAVGDEITQWRSVCIWVANEYCRKGGR